jgi:hypothetical protein
MMQVDKVSLRDANKCSMSRQSFFLFCVILQASRLFASRLRNYECYIQQVTASSVSFPDVNFLLEYGCNSANFVFIYNLVIEFESEIQ